MLLHEIGSQGLLPYWVSSYTPGYNLKIVICTSLFICHAFIGSLCSDRLTVALRLSFLFSDLDFEIVWKLWRPKTGLCNELKYVHGSIQATC